MRKIIKLTLIISIILNILTIGILLNKQNKDTFKVTNILYQSTDNFYLEPNEIGIEFSNGSWAVVNLEKNIYIFQPSELGDYDLKFNSLDSFKNCIATYKSILNNGSY